MNALMESEKTTEKCKQLNEEPLFVTGSSQLFELSMHGKMTHQQLWKDSKEFCFEWIALVPSLKQGDSINARMMHPCFQICS